MMNNNELFEKAKNLHFNGKIKEAQNLYLKLIREHKNSGVLYYLLGTSFLQIKKYSQAINYLKISIDLNPKSADSYNNMGVALAENENFSEALKNYDKAIDLKKQFVDAYLNKGIALNALKNYDEALDYINKAISLDTNNAKAYNSLGNIYNNKKKFEDSFKAYRKAINIKPNYIQALSNASDLLFLFKKYEESLIYLNKIYELNPDLDGLLNKIFSNKIHIADWSNYNDLIKKIKNKIINKISIIDPLLILYMSDDSKIIKINSEEYIKKNHKKSNQKYQEDLNKFNLTNKENKKIKIAYFSGDFHNHPVLYHMSEIYKNHDRNKFEIYAFSHGRTEENIWRKEIKKYFNKFYIINQLSDEKVVKLCRDLQIDIAINLTGFTKNLRTDIFIKRVAPIQINYLGYPATMGTKSIDYIIADKTVIPENEKKFFVEKVEYLQNCYTPKPLDTLLKKSKKNYIRKNFSLPDKEIVFCSITNPIKITPEMFDLWIDILKKVKGSVLWLATKNEKFKENISKEAEKRGLEKNRLIFTEIIKQKEDHLNRLALADIFLDTFPYVSHSTTYDYIDIGLPSVSLKGKSFASRVSASIYSQIDLDELIAINKNEYVNIAVNLATNKNKLNKVREKLKNYKNVFNTKDFTKNLEKIYLKLYKQNFNDN